MKSETKEKEYKNWFFKLILGIMILCFKLYFKFSFEGKEKLPKSGPAIYVANHRFWFDMFPIMYYSKTWVYWLSKFNIASVKGLKGWFFKIAKVLPVDREHPNPMLIKNILKTIKSNKVIGVFPEGTRVTSLEQLATMPVHSGGVYFSARFKCPVYPIGASGGKKFRSELKFVVGDPYTIDIPMSEYKEREQELTDDMMRRIYALTDLGEDYVTFKNTYMEGQEHV